MLSDVSTVVVSSASTPSSRTSSDEVSFLLKCDSLTVSTFDAKSSSKSNPSTSDFNFSTCVSARSLDASRMIASLLKPSSSPVVSMIF